MPHTDICEMASDEHRHFLRMNLEDIIFDDLRERYGPVLKEFWDQATFPTTSSNTVMLVERRPHPNIEFVLHNFMYFTRIQNFSLTIVCSRENEDFIRKILGKHAATTHFIVPFETNADRDTARHEYNCLMKSEEFWKQIRADYVLSIQTDCYLRKPLPEKLWELDYVASPWAWRKDLVGGSGLTFRKKEAVLDMCKRGFAGAGLCPKGLCPKGEDVFFSEKCAEFSKKIMPFEEAIEVFSESCIVDDPVGVHQWWTYLFQGEFEKDEVMMNTYHEIYTTLDI